MTYFNQVLHSFIASIEQCPNHHAFCIDEVYYTYQQFSERIQAIRHTLKLHQQSTKEIGLVVNDDIDTYASVFALWMEGYAYIPLHPLQPLERCEDICTQVGCTTILDSSKETRYKDYHVVATQNLENQLFDTHYDASITDDALCYVLFTSGSTGKPKGVKITRQNIHAFVEAFEQTEIQLTPEDRCLQCFDMTFDVSVQSYLLPLLHGACVYTVPHDQIKFSYVAGLIEDYDLTFGAMAPSMVRFLKPYFDEIYSESFKHCILTAEASPVELVKEWHERCIPNATIYNFYGPTEATIYCSYYKLPSTCIKTHNGIVVIGKVFNGLDVVIVDENNIPLKSGKSGEMLISGPQITPGYWNNPEMDAKAFQALTLENETKLYYRTGDICSIDIDGNIAYQGRIDSQIKINGYRIELGEIEYHARSYYQGSNAVALAQQHEGNTQIVLIVEHQVEDISQLMIHLRSVLPQYMIPSRVIYTGIFPLNANGKVDKNKLRILL
ncbi:AMP-binding protein [Gammaproteobacteria bacterium]|nr:AMP-binding protein [Gammaproteobacteria bacterium]